MDYKKYKEAKEYVKSWESERAKIQNERIKLRNPVLYTDNYLSITSLRLYNAQKEYSEICFLYDHNTDFGIYKDYLQQCRKNIFQMIRLKHEYKKSLK